MRPMETTYTDPPFTIHKTATACGTAGCIAGCSGGRTGTAAAAAERTFACFRSSATPPTEVSGKQRSWGRGTEDGGGGTIHTVVRERAVHERDRLESSVEELVDQKQLCVVLRNSKTKMRQDQNEARP